MLKLEYNQINMLLFDPNHFPSYISNFKRFSECEKVEKVLGMAEFCICAGVKNLLFHLLCKLQMLVPHLQDRDRDRNWVPCLSCRIHVSLKDVCYTFGCLDTLHEDRQWRYIYEPASSNDDINRKEDSGRYKLTGRSGFSKSCNWDEYTETIDWDQNCRGNLSLSAGLRIRGHFLAEKADWSRSCCTKVVIAVSLGICSNNTDSLRRCSSNDSSLTIRCAHCTISIWALRIENL